MSALVRRVDGWLAAPAPADRLAVLRVLTSLFATGYLVVRLPAYEALTDAPSVRFEPVGVLAWLDSPLSAPVWMALVAAALVAGAASVAGAWFRVSGPAFAALLLIVTTYRSSWGQLLWFEALVVLHILIIGVAPSADDVAVDARRARPAPRPGGDYGFPIRLAAIVTVATYVLAGIAKLRLAGTDWMAGDTLRNHIAYSAARLELLGASPSPLAGPVMAHAALLAPMAVATVVIELAAPVALLGGWIRSLWVAAAWAMHAAIAAMMFVVFPYPLMLVAFAPLFPVERMRPRRWARRREPGGAPRPAV
jgi:hypothetical protein